MQRKESHSIEWYLMGESLGCYPSSQWTAHPANDLDQGDLSLPSGNVTIMDQVIGNLPGYPNILNSSTMTGMQTFMCLCRGREK